MSPTATLALSGGRSAYWLREKAGSIRPAGRTALRAEEPPTWRFDPDGKHVRLTLPDIEIPHWDLKDLEQYVPPEKRDPTRIENASAFGDAHRDLMEANRYYRATVGVWLAQFATLFFFLTASLLSAWAVDYLLRSGRGPVARIF